ncbi:MAG: hypothetical protein ACP5NP_00335 [Acetobacteraceae bacterium]
MANVSLLLGPVEFRSLEIPQHINFGGAQRIAVHRLLGGQRVLDALGRDDSDISFSGIFTSTDATLRARLLDELRVAGATLPLVWDVFFYTVLIAQFEAEYQNPGWVPYRIRCTVLRDEASAAIGATLSLAANTLSDITSAASLAAGAGIDLSSVVTATTAPGATIRGTAAHVSAQAATGGVAASLEQQLAATGTTVEQIFPSGAMTADQGVASLTSAAGATQQLAGMAAARGYLGRVAANLTTASS